MKRIIFLLALLTIAQSNHLYSQLDSSFYYISSIIIEIDDEAVDTYSIALRSNDSLTFVSNNDSNNSFAISKKSIFDIVIYLVDDTVVFENINPLLKFEIPHSLDVRIHDCHSKCTFASYHTATLTHISAGREVAFLDSNGRFLPGVKCNYLEVSPFNSNKYIKNPPDYIYLKH